MREIDPRWYETFFGGEWLETVALRIDPERTEREVGFVADTLALPEGARILDLACGHGRHAVELARRGYRVTGLDLSGPSLDAARARAAEAGVEVELVQGDMRGLDRDGEFDAVVNLFSAFGYFEHGEDDQRVLDGVARALVPGGLFLLDTINQTALLRRFEERRWSEEEDGTLFLEERAFDPVTGRSNATWTIVHPDGSHAELAHSMRVYTYPELAVMLARAGLEHVSAYGGFDGAEYGLDAWRMIVVARRPA